VPIHNGILRDMVGANYYRQVVRHLVADGILWQSSGYAVDRESKRYDLGQHIAVETRSKVHRVTDATLARKLREWRERRRAEGGPVRWQLGLNLAELDLDADAAGGILDDMESATGRSGKPPGGNMNSFIGWLATTRAVIQRFLEPGRGGLVYHPRDRWGRMHTVLSVMPSGLRGFLSHKGEPLWTVDLRNSQLTLLYLLALERHRGPLPDDLARYGRDAFAGNLYEILGERSGLGLPRSQVKRLAFGVIFGRPGSRDPDRLAMAEAFRAEYPTVLGIAEEIRSEAMERDPAHGHGELARQLQSREAALVIDGDRGLGGRNHGAASVLLRDNPGMFLGSIHDSLVMVERDIPLAVGAFKAAFAAHGAPEPRLSIEPCRRALTGPNPADDGLGDEADDIDDEDPEPGF
jgi:hypothetical protein